MQLNIPDVNQRIEASINKKPRKLAIDRPLKTQRQKNTIETEESKTVQSTLIDETLPKKHHKFKDLPKVVA